MLARKIKRSFYKFKCRRRRRLVTINIHPLVFICRLIEEKLRIVRTLTVNVSFFTLYHIICSIM